MPSTIRTWTRPELEAAAAHDPNERTMLRVPITPKLLLLLIDYASQKGERVEMVSAYGEPDACELRFFRRDES